MKKIFKSFLLVIVTGATLFAAPKKGNSNTVKLDAKKKFAIEGVELGTSALWAKASIDNKGVITWHQDSAMTCYETGWDLKNVDLSKYDGIRIELAKDQNQEAKLLLANSPVSQECWAYEFDSDGVVVVPFNGAGNIWGAMEIPVLEKGFEINIQVPPVKYVKTVIKSVELFKKGSLSDSSKLVLEGRVLGSFFYKSKVLGNEITFLEGLREGECGWNLSGIDLSDYDRIRIEVENNDVKNLELRLRAPDHGNYHVFNSPVEKNVWEADLSGDGATYIEPNGVPFDKSKGMKIFFGIWYETPSEKDQKLTIKSVELLKGKKQKNENLKFLGKDFGSSVWKAFPYDEGNIEWIYDKNNNYPFVGWNLRGVDLTGVEKIRIEIESSNVPNDIFLSQDGCNIGFDYVRPNVYEVNLDGTDCSWTWPEGAKWDISKGVNEICVRVDGLKRTDGKTKVKSVTIMNPDELVQFPENLILDEVKLGKIKHNAWLDENFAINWGKASYAQCGWFLESLDADVIEVNCSLTECPLRFRIRDKATGNEVCWVDDGTHTFRINLKTKKHESKNSLKDPEWEKFPKKLDLSQGCDVVLEPVNAGSAAGKKTVVGNITAIKFLDEE